MIQKKVILFFLLFTVFNNVFSQNTDTEKNYKYLVGISVNQGMSSKTKLTRDELPKYTFLSGGINIKYLISEKFAIQSGAIFNDKGYIITNVMAFPDDISPKIKTRTHQFYIDIPILCQYNFLKKSKIVYYIAGGLVGNIFLSDDTGIIYDYNNNKTGIIFYHEDNYKPVSVSIQQSLGFDFSLTNRFTLSVAEVFQHALMEFQNNHKTFKDYGSPIPVIYPVIEPKFKFIPYFIGVNISLMFKF